MKEGLLIESEATPLSIHDIMLNKDSLTASAIVSHVRQNQSESWSLSNCFAAMAQLGQMLLYMLDDIPRGTSNTLWMRKILINISPGIPSLHMPQPIYVRLDNAKKLKMANQDWRSADVFSLVCNINMVCRVAHRI
jgi:hypothetical protein